MMYDCDEERKARQELAADTDYDPTVIERWVAARYDLEEGETLGDYLQARMLQAKIVVAFYLTLGALAVAIVYGLRLI